MWLADHGTSGPEVVLAVGVAPSRGWAEQWYGLVVAVAPCSVAGCGPGCVSPSSPHALLPAVALAVVPAVADGPGCGGVAPSRIWVEQWYGLVVAVAPCSVAGCGPGCVSPSSPHALLPAALK